MSYQGPRWTAERIEQLRQLCNQDPVLTHADIAAVLGVTIATVQYQRWKLSGHRRDTRFKAQSTAVVAPIEDKSDGWGLRIVDDYTLKSDALPLLWCGDYKSFAQLQEMLRDT